MAFSRQMRGLIAHSPNDFRSLSNESIPWSYFLLSAGFHFPSLTHPGSFSAVSVVGLDSSVVFSHASHSQSFNFLCSFSLF
jgi:hypothetical protein